MTRHLPRIPRKHQHFAFAVIQAGLTAGMASGVANVHLIRGSTFVLYWMESWLTSWAVMVPIVLLAAPVIRGIVSSMSYE